MGQSMFSEILSSMSVAQGGLSLNDQAGLLLALFMAGLAGGASHCVGMCGPFVLTQVQARLEAVSASHMSEFKRLTGGALVPYHLGRMTTYTLLGAVVGVAAQQVMKIPGLGTVAAVLLVGAAVFFFGYALRSSGLVVRGWGWKKASHGCTADEPPGARGWLAEKWATLTRPLFAHPVGWRGYGLGVVLGFIPCGMVYGALAVAAASANAPIGALSMAAFGLGTVPALFGLGVSGGVVLGRWPNVARHVAPVLLIVNGGFLLYLATRLL